MKHNQITKNILYKWSNVINLIFWNFSQKLYGLYLGTEGVLKYYIIELHVKMNMATCQDEYGDTTLVSKMLLFNLES
jgi:hypothetical protein